MADHIVDADGMVAGAPDMLHVDLASIDIPEARLREVDPERVAEMALSMKASGQITPVMIAPADAAGRHVLVAGAHRLHAAREAGLSRVMAVIFSGSEDETRLREIDENLYRAELSPYDQASFLAERRAIYERINGAVRPGRRNSDKLSQLSFFDDVTGKFGLPKRMIQRALKRHAEIAPEVWARLRGHPVTKNASELDKLSAQHPTVQARIARLITQAVRPARNVSEAMRAMSDAPVESADDRGYRVLCAAWGKATPKARSEFVAFLTREGGVR